MVLYFGGEVVVLGYPMFILLMLGTMFPRISFPMWVWIQVGQKESCMRLGKQE